MSLYKYIGLYIYINGLSFIGHCYICPGSGTTIVFWCLLINIIIIIVIVSVVYIRCETAACLTNIYININPSRRCRKLQDDAQVTTPRPAVSSCRDTKGQSKCLCLFCGLKLGTRCHCAKSKLFILNGNKGLFL